MTQLVVKILSLVADLFMCFCQTYFLFLIVMAAFFASAEFSLLSCKLLFSFSVIHRILSFRSVREHGHSLHGKIYTQHLLCFIIAHLVFAALILIEK